MCHFASIVATESVAKILGQSRVVTTRVLLTVQNVNVRKIHSDLLACRVVVRALRIHQLRPAFAQKRLRRGSLRSREARTKTGGGGS